MRQQELLAIRPALYLPETETGTLEHFQNTSLRPILKYQHHLLVLLFKNHIKKRKNVFFKLTEIEKLSYIEQVIKMDLSFKNRLMGIIIGHFIHEELMFFTAHETELSRRLTDLLVQRLQSATKDFTIFATENNVSQR
jgi:hypothetical protein